MNQKLYFAPMEGVAGYIYRNLHQKYFGGADKYFSPFLCPNQNRKLTPGEARDVLPENNTAVRLVPQILTNRAEDFLWAAGEMEARGYQEINLNLGCPSGTVVSKRRGAGFLAYPEELDRFLEQVFEGTRLRISVKTRLGMEKPEEFQALLPVFNRYPICELIIHPRVRADFYRRTPNLEAFRQALLESGNPVCYNGDIFTAGDCERLAGEFPGAQALMLGRGILGNPGLLREIRTGQAMTKAELKAFLEELCQAYQEIMPGEVPVLFKLKELWFYMAPLFTGGEKQIKKIKKAKRLAEYRAASDALFDSEDLIPGAGFPGTP